MNLTCKIMCNINILKIWIILFVIEFSEYHIFKNEWI
jgi:hypothetical protein